MDKPVIITEPLEDFSAATVASDDSNRKEDQRQTTKDEAASLVKDGDYEAAFNKILELI